MISVPVLFTHGGKDGVVAYQLSTSNAEAIAGARMSTYEGIQRGVWVLHTSGTSPMGVGHNRGMPVVDVETR